MFRDAEVLQSVTRVNQLKDLGMPNFLLRLLLIAMVGKTIELREKLVNKLRHFPQKIKKD